MIWHIMKTAKEREKIPYGKKNENPRAATLGFSVRYGELIRLGWCYLIVSVQPFAYVVADYTCYDRNKKRENDVLHTAHLLSAGGSAAGIE